MRQAENIAEQVVNILSQIFSSVGTGDQWTDDNADTLNYAAMLGGMPDTMAASLAHGIPYNGFTKGTFLGGDERPAALYQATLTGFTQPVPVAYWCDTWQMYYPDALTCPSGFRAVPQ